MPKSAKVARYRQSPDVAKKAVASKEPKIEVEGPIAWRFSETDRGGPFPWDIADDAKFRKVMERLHGFEDKTAEELKSTGSHSVEVTSLCDAARRRLTEVELDDIVVLTAFRITRANRVWCFRRSGSSVMRVLWWDENHKVYPMATNHADRIKEKNKQKR